MSNLFELYLAFGRMPNAQVDSRPDLLRVKTGLPHELLNGIFRARLEEEDVDSAIRAALEDFLVERIPVTWWVGPLTQPADLDRHLARHGLVRTSDITGMAIDLDAIDLPRAIPRELSIEPVRDVEGLEAWMGPYALANQLSPQAAQGLFEFFLSVGFAPTTPFRHYVGRWMGRPAASSTLFFGAGVGGVYVSILPEFQKLGIGASLSLVALRAAKASGYHVGITHVPEYRLGFHRKLGFIPYCNLSTYVPRALPGGA